MSLAEDLRRPFEGGVRRGAAVRSLTVKDANPAAADATKPPPVELRPRAEPVPVDGAADSMNLLDRASKSVVFLLGRYQQLEDHVRQLDAWSKAQIGAAEAAAARWQEAAEEAEGKMHAAQAALDAMRSRVEVAEQALERDARTLHTLQERIIASFGFGSEAHDALTQIGAA